MSRGKSHSDWARRHGITEQDVIMYSETFCMIDRDKDGLITPGELLDALKLLGCRTSLDQAVRMVQMVDQNGDGKVDVNEYLSMILRSPVCLRPDLETECWMTFKMFDKNQDGYISLEELRETMSMLGQSLTNDEALAMLQAMDLNHDGLISYSEFIASWTDWIHRPDKEANGDDDDA